VSSNASAVFIAEDGIVLFEGKQGTRRGMTAMSTEKRNDENIPPLTDAYYEEQASQEEFYLEETEEELRMILECDDSSPLQSEVVRVERKYVVEELITRNADDPPLREDAAEEMLRSIFRDLDR
jgi:hypothetical protein